MAIDGACLFASKVLSMRGERGEGRGERGGGRGEGEVGGGRLGGLVWERNILHKIFISNIWLWYIEGIINKIMKRMK